MAFAGALGLQLIAQVPRPAGLDDDIFGSLFSESATRLAEVCSADAPAFEAALAGRPSPRNRHRRARVNRRLRGRQRARADCRLRRHGRHRRGIVRGKFGLQVCNLLEAAEHLRALRSVLVPRYAQSGTKSNTNAAGGKLCKANEVPAKR